MTQAWSPIGGITFYREGEHTSTLEDPAIVKIAESHSKSPAQVMLRWHLQEGRSVIPMIEVNLLGAISRALGLLPSAVWMVCAISYCFARFGDVAGVFERFLS